MFRVRLKLGSLGRVLHKHRYVEILTDLDAIDLTHILCASNWLQRLQSRTWVSSLSREFNMLITGHRCMVRLINPKHDHLHHSESLRVSLTQCLEALPQELVTRNLPSPDRADCPKGKVASMHS